MILIATDPNCVMTLVPISSSKVGPNYIWNSLSVPRLYKELRIEYICPEQIVVEVAITKLSSSYSFIHCIMCPDQGHTVTVTNAYFSSEDIVRMRNC